MKNRIRQISIKYNLKREYFTLLLPGIIAVLLIAGSYFMEQTEEKPAFIIEGVPEANNTVASSSAPVSMGIDQIMVIALLVAITPYSMDVYFTEKRRKRYEEEFAGFLYELSELLRGGLDPLSAIKEIASPTVETERSLRAIGPHLKKAAALLDWGRPFETVITRFAESLKSPLISKYSYLIVQASSMGGANATTILKSSQDLEKTLQIEREKDGMLKEYLFIIFAAQFILIGILYLLNTTLLPSIISMLKSGVGSAFGISAAATNINFKQGFFHVIMINAFASGIIAGQLTEGKARHGLKHSVILMTISYAASLIFLLR